MRRPLLFVSPVLLALGVLMGAVLASPAGAAPSGSTTAVLFVVTPSAGYAQAVTTTVPKEAEAPGDGNRLSMLPQPNSKGGSGNNLGGLLVGIFLLGGWALLGVYLFHQGKGRRAEMKAALEAEHRAAANAPV
jgi:hypothetical protein